MAQINVDYGFYADTFKGTVIPESAFGKLALDGEAFVARMTFDRIHKYNLCMEDKVAVKMAICAVAETKYKIDGHQDIKSENNDGYSVTYADTSENASRARMTEAADLYLSITTLRNRMVSYDY